jgi:hypothetical protein
MRVLIHTLLAWQNSREYTPYFAKRGAREKVIFYSSSDFSERGACERPKGFHNVRTMEKRAVPAKHVSIFLVAVSFDSPRLAPRDCGTPLTSFVVVPRGIGRD